MKIKVLKILERKDPYKPEGKNYTIYKYICELEIEGKNIPFAAVQTFTDKIKVEAGQEYECEKDEKYGDVKYNIKSEKKGFKPYQKEKNLFNWETFESIIDRLWNKVISYSLKEELTIQLFEKMIGCASVMLNPDCFKKKEDEKSSNDDDVPF